VNGLIGLDVHKQIATVVSADPNTTAHKIVAKVFEVVIGAAGLAAVLFRDLRRVQGDRSSCGRR
jgi:hypothetical protein